MELRMSTMRESRQRMPESEKEAERSPSGDLVRHDSTKHTSSLAALRSVARRRSRLALPSEAVPTATAAAISVAGTIARHVTRLAAAAEQR